MLPLYVCVCAPFDVTVIVCECVLDPPVLPSDVPAPPATPIGKRERRSGRLKVVADVLPYVVPTTVNRSGYAARATDVPVQSSHPVGAAAPAYITTVPVGGNAARSRVEGTPLTVIVSVELPVNARLDVVSPTFKVFENTVVELTTVLPVVTDVAETLTRPDVFASVTIVLLTVALADVFPTVSAVGPNDTFAPAKNPVVFASMVPSVN